MTAVTVLGAGAFGTALAIAFARAGTEVTLVARSEESAATLERDRSNARRLPGIAFPRSITLSADPGAGAPDAPRVLAVPAQATGSFLARHAARIAPGPLVLAAKGIDLDSGLLLSEVAAKHWPDEQIAALSGPGFAAEIAAGLPTALTLAAADAGRAEALQTALSTTTLRLYRSTDRIGVQLGGALKNVVAIACGICIGAGLGESARAALMTRGYAEILRLGLACGARPETFAGLSGLGDLALTAASPKSRNFAAGVAIGEGGVPASGTVEGLSTAHAVLAMAKRHEVDMPVAATTVEVLDKRLSIGEAMDRLLARPLKEET